MATRYTSSTATLLWEQKSVGVFGLVFLAPLFYLARPGLNLIYVILLALGASVGLVLIEVVTYLAVV